MGRSRVIETRRFAAAMVLAFVLVLAGCGDSSPDAIAAGPGTKPKPARPAPPQDDMVAAFSATHGQGLVDLRFKLDKRPAVGEPVDIELTMVPTVPLERVFARFQPSEGLQIVSGEETRRFDRPALGAALNHTLSVTAKTDGILYVSAVVLADSDSASVSRTFFIPLIAGRGLTELPAAPAAASVANPRGSPDRP